MPANTNCEVRVPVDVYVSHRFQQYLKTDTLSRPLLARFRLGPESCWTWSGGNRLPSVYMDLLVPAYFYPAGPNLPLWSRLADVSRKLGPKRLAVIANVHNGPGKQVDGNYERVRSTIELTCLIIFMYNMRL